MCPLQVLEPIQEAIMVVDAHPYVVNALAVCTATAEASAKLSAPMSDLMRRCLEEELPPACSPLPADSTFRALFNGEIRIHQGEALAQHWRMRRRAPCAEAVLDCVHSQCPGGCLFLLAASLCKLRQGLGKSWTLPRQWVPGAECNLIR